MHVEQSVVESALHGFPRHQAQFAALAASNMPAQVYDLSEQGPFMERILAEFYTLGESGEMPASEVAFLMMRIMSLLPARPLSRVPGQQTVASRIMSWVEAN